MLYKEYVNCRKQYQEIGAQLLLEKKHACLFFEPGKGKTYSCIDALTEVNRQKQGKASVLIISSADAIKKMWKVDIVPQNVLPKDTYLVTDRTAIGDMSEILLLKKWDVIIVDECHIIKAHNSKIHKLVYRLCKNVEYAWGMTGTPRGNTDVDIWCQLQALHIGGQGRMSYSAWTRIYCDFETGYGAYGRYQIPVSIKLKYKEWWDNLLTEYCLFVNYDEDDDMPDLNIETINIPYVKTKEYQNAIQGIIEVGDFATTTEKMIAIRKAQQVCNGYIYLPDKTVHRYNANSKLNELDKYVTERTLIVYQYIADYDDLIKKYGSSATTDVNKFKTGQYQILLLQSGNCKSFNLQEWCHTIIFYTMDYSFLKYKQMIHRCWRLGQKVATKVLVLIHENTVEKQIWIAVQSKQKAHDLYMSITQAV